MKHDISSIRVGDFIHLDVPQNRMLEAGKHKARVHAIHPQARRFEKSYIIEVALNGDFDSEDCINVFILFSTSRSLYLTGHGFFGLEQWPVRFSHEPNIERRLKDSVTALEKEREHAK